MTMPNKRTEAAEQAAIQRNAVTVPADKLAELQRKAKLVDELLEALENMIDINDRHQEAWNEAKDAIAKAKGE